MRILSVLISYPLGSALIGWVIDRLAGTEGIWVAMLFLGFGAAMWEVWKISQQSPQ
jgi:F0F1-type ATP synthase assembly protein I